MEVMEQYDSDECSVEPEDSEEDSARVDDDGYDVDFVLPDHVVVYENGMVVDHRGPDNSEGIFGRAMPGQRDSVIETRDGQIITVKWAMDHLTDRRDPDTSTVDEEDDSIFSPDDGDDDDDE